ncbi:capping protein inhibiting regulator of actin dynamics isoform X2 [Denticeps clupeoides]|nr:uncharacterized protein KIAA1211 homolog isoform X2 [Denticeps clupeoides]
MVSEDDSNTNQQLRELNPLGSRALSHDSIFIPDDSAEKPSAEQTMSQENVSDKVRSLQKQIAQSIKFGQKPASLRKSEGDSGSSDEEEVPRSPLKVSAQVEAEPVESESKVAAHGTPVKSPRSKRVFPPEGTIESINLDAVPQSGPRLDNAAAKHKLSVKPKNQRISRKHHRFTQDLQDVSLPGTVHEETDIKTQVEESEIPRDHCSMTAGFRDVAEPPEKSKKPKLHQEEPSQLELKRKRELEEQEERRKAEEQRLEEEKLHRLEEEHRKREQEEEERRRRREEEARRMKEEEEKRRKEEEERQRREVQEKRVREEEEKRREEARRKEEEERKHLEAEYLRLEKERKLKEAEEAERKKKEEEEKLLELLEKQRREEERICEEEERKRQEEKEAEMRRRAEEEERMKEEAIKRQQEHHESVSEGDKVESISDPLEWKRKAEELRWKEMEDRQPFTFKVSSGEKQILFQKVNLTPVTPASSQQGATSFESREGAKASAPAGQESPTLSSSLYVPHTAILVTGAQLCGPAVNLDQIKDTACKSLLGLSEDKTVLASVQQPKSKSSPERKSGKAKSLNESSLTSDKSSAAVLAEWASIRSKIFKGAEDGKYQNYPEPAQSRKQDQSRPTSEDQSQFPHTNLRKTMSASAKFSITPARKKFGDSNRNSEILAQEDKEEKKIEPSSPEPVGPSSISSVKTQNRGSKSVRIADSAEECMFAKDLPSFLVPSPPHGSPRFHRPDTEVLSQASSEGSSSEIRDGSDQKGQASEELPSPFGIKLRRTNYSLRFHNEQPTEKRKKRYSAGDNFDGVPKPLTPIDPDSDSPVFLDRSSPTSPLRESAENKQTSDSFSKIGKYPVASISSEGEQPISKAQLYQKPVTKFSDRATPTPSPPSTLLTGGRGVPGDSSLDQRKEVVHLDSGEDHSDETNHAPESVQTQKISQGEEEPKEKKSFFPSISIPWREKTDRKTELIRREKPSLQSRHSLDSSKVQEKEAAPLWITLALQKQKGFREQQQSREERRNQREAKLAEKQAREKENSGLTSPMEGKGNGNTTPPKPQTPEEGKRPDTLLARFERRDNLKKANTLPSSVTVEITDLTPSPPAVKEVSKRFPPGDSSQVSTEPAWLALAKRKAKAWSDCPQIIK